MAREDWTAEALPFFVDSYARVHIGKPGMLHADLARTLGISQHSSFSSGYYIRPLRGLLWYSNPTRDEARLVVEAFLGRGMPVRDADLSFAEMYGRMARQENSAIASSQAKMAYKLQSRDRYGMRREDDDDMDMACDELVEAAYSFLERLVEENIDARFARIRARTKKGNSPFASLKKNSALKRGVKAGARVMGALSTAASISARNERLNDNWKKAGERLDHILGKARKN